MSQKKVGIREIKNEQDVTVDFIAKEADNIWEECVRQWDEQTKRTKKAVTVDDEKFLNDLFERLCEKHKKFHQAYPTVLRHMVQDMMYSSDVFRNYLLQLEKKPCTKDAEKFDSYTEYFVELYRYYMTRAGKKLTEKEIAHYKTDYRKRLQDAHDSFYSKHDDIKKEVDESYQIYERQERTDLVLALERLILEQIEMNKKLNITSQEIQLLNDSLANKIKEIHIMVSENRMTTSTLKNIVYGLRERMMKASETKEAPAPTVPAPKDNPDENNM